MKDVEVPGIALVCAVLLAFLLALSFSGCAWSRNVETHDETQRHEERHDREEAQVRAEGSQHVDETERLTAGPVELDTTVVEPVLLPDGRVAVLPDGGIAERTTHTSARPTTDAGTVLERERHEQDDAGLAVTVDAGRDDDLATAKVDDLAKVTKAKGGPPAYVWLLLLGGLLVVGWLARERLRALLPFPLP